MVCNGHYSLPSVPELPGIDLFDGLVMHSHDYRIPEVFKNKTVAILGAAASGSDIGLEIATAGGAQQVYLCHNNPRIPSRLPDNFKQKAGIVEIAGPSDVTLQDHSTLRNVQVLIFCTGYQYSFPFLDQKVRPQIENRVVWPLFKHMIHVDYPKLCFIGIPIQICPFPQFDLQVRCFVKSLTGEIVLPSRDEMYADTCQELQAKLEAGVPRKHFHKMGADQWDYNRSLCQLARLPLLPLRVEKLYNDVHDFRRKNLVTYKQNNYELNSTTGEFCMMTH